MKDSYTFDRDADGLEAQYQKHIQAYDRMFDRCGLEWYRVESDVGVMGGSGAHEYMAPCAAGENDVALAEGYAANVEIATAEAQPVEQPSWTEGIVETPGATTIDAVAGMLEVPAGRLMKAMPVIVDSRGPVLVLVRGDHQLNEIKLRNAFKADTRLATEDEVRSLFGTHPGFIGPVGAKVPVAADLALRDSGSYVAGANEPDKHVTGVTPVDVEWIDVRSVVAGDRAPNGGTIRIEPAIEVGNIFKLGTRYSVPLGANYLDENGKEQPIVMGSYGIGPARIMAAAVEQFADDAGISWPRSISPFDVELVALGKPGEEALEVAERLYDELRATGLDVLYDDRSSSPGEKFADAELLGVPLRLTVGRKALEAGELEAQIRRGQDKRALPLEGAAESAAALWRELP
jgi:prolyl-tRNA synthetase